MQFCIPMRTIWTQIPLNMTKTIACGHRGRSDHPQDHQHFVTITKLLRSKTLSISHRKDPKTSTSESIQHSGSRTFAPSPLDVVPPSLYKRFPRFPTTTE